ncbi:MAG: class I SAM-dependent methyltransferase [Leptospiraceae bacterium]|nr:class I SAM-dependent methyltransferase [Leptospiraceae bacterium]
MKIWNEHYTKEKSRLIYPDENLVRILAKLPHEGKALDFGAGSGRHSFLLKSLGFQVTALDYAKNSLQMIQEFDKDIHVVHAESPPYPFIENEFSVIVSWGVLHYNTDEEIIKILQEYKRILKENGYLIGTLRANTDTHLKLTKGKIALDDLKNAQARLFNLEEVQNLLKDFKNLQIGYMERTPLGKLEERICHWIFLAQK